MKCQSVAAYLLTAALVAAPFGLAAAAAAAEQPHIVFITHGQAGDPFWNAIKNGMERAAKETGATVDYRSPPTFDMVAMGQLIEAAVTQEPDGLVVTIPDGEALGPVLRKAADAGIPVISINSGADVSKKLGALLHVGMDEYTAGKLAGEALAVDGKNAICVNPEVGNTALDARCNGFSEGFGGTVTVLPVGRDPSDVRAKVRAAIDSDPTIDTVMSLSAAVVGEPAIPAIEAAGRTDSIKLATFDVSPGFLQAVSEGKAEFAIDQAQFLQGYLPVVFLSLYSQYGLIPGGDVSSGPILITKDKAAQVLELAADGIR